MKLKDRVKILARSGSLGFVRDFESSAADGVTHTYHWRGREIHYRPGTSDLHLIYQILIRRGRKAEYHVPVSLKPGVIFDIGANIGAATAYLAATYPEARIFSFEPVPANFAVLTKNVAAFNNVEAFNFGLGVISCSLDLYASDNAVNFGGFSCAEHGSDPSRKTSVEIRGVGDFLKEREIQSVDLIKIDTEGAEDEIIRAFPEAVISRVGFIMGELHGTCDFEMLAYLSKWFSVGMKKNMRRRLFNFEACNRSIVDDLS